MHLQSSQEEYEVEEIRQEKFFNGKPYYLIKWKGFPENQCTWQPIENMENSLTYLIEWKKQKLIDFEKQKNQKGSPTKNSFLQERQFNYHVKSSKKSSREKPWKNLLGIQKQNRTYDENGQEKTKRKLKRPAQDSNDEQLNLEKWKIHKIPKQNQQAVVKIQANSSNRSRPINENKREEDKIMKKDKFVKIQQFSPEKNPLQIKQVNNILTQNMQKQIQKPLQQQQQQQLEEQQIVMLNRPAQCIIQQQNDENPKQVYYCQKQKSIAQQLKEPQKISQHLQQNEQLVLNDDTTKINTHLNQNQNSLISSLKPDNIEQASTAIRQVEFSPINQLDQFKQVQQERPTNEIIPSLKDIQIVQNPLQISVERISKMIYICSRKYFQVQLSDGKSVLLSHENTKNNFPIKLCDYYELSVIDFSSVEAEELLF